jgi:outer membrane protein assembly factor BamB
VRLGAVVALSVVVLVGCGGKAADPRPAVWTAPGADRQNTRHVGGLIDARSVTTLHRVWSLPLTSLYVASPVVVGGIAYTADLGSNVYAIDVATGRLRWRRTLEVGAPGPNGVDVAGGRVYGVLPDSAFALDARTGRQLWHTRLARSRADLVVMTPGHAHGLTYVSTVPGTAGGIGTLWALDDATGRRVWKWEEVPATLWGHPEVNGGGGLWHPPAFDERGGLYISIANPIPFPGTRRWPWGSSRPGDNRWDNSIVKLDARTGRFLWGWQALPHDVYDWDLEGPAILVRRPGGRLVALTSGKLGWVFALDADTGALLWRRSVGIHNGHDHDNLLAMRGQLSRLKLGVKLLPGGWGGVETPMASDGATVYVPVNDFAGIYPTMRFAPPQQADPMTGKGELVAIDVDSGRVRWDLKLPHGMYGAATVSNDVVFTTTYDGTLWGVDARSGKVLWRAPLPAATDAPVTISGSTLITAGSIPLREDEHPAIVAYRPRG